MIPVKPVSKPKSFDAKCKIVGKKWLAANPGAKRPRDYWTQFKGELADGFSQRCGYTAMYCPVGTVDHYLSWQNHPSRAYDWENYRFADGWINSSKQAADDAVLDPFVIGEGWFEILLPSLQLVVTDRVPAEERKRAKYTLKRLHLRDDERVIRQRRTWLALYEQGDLTLAGLAKVAPLIAAAVAKRDRSTRKRRGRATP